MSDSVQKFYMDEENFAPKEELKTAREQAIEIIEELLLDKTISIEVTERLIKLRSLMFNLKDV